MSKKRVLCFVLAVALLLCGCAPKRAPYGQLKKSDYLRAKKDEIVNAAGEKIEIKSMSVRFEDFSSQLVRAKQNGYNMVSLTVPYTDISDNWKLTQKGKQDIVSYINETEKAGLLLSLAVDTEDTDNIWDEQESDKLAALWGEIAALGKEQKALGAYCISFSYRPLITDQTTSLTVYEGVLQKITKKIRSADRQHLILVAQIPQYHGGIDSYYGLPSVKDKNFAYITDLQEISWYTTQAATEAAYDFLCYPNQYYAKVENEQYIGGYEGKTADVSQQRTAQEIATDLIKIPKSEKVQYATVGVNVFTDGGGELWIDALKVECFDRDGALEKTVLKIDNTKGVMFFKGDSGGNEIVSEYDEETETCYIPNIPDSAMLNLHGATIPLESGKQYKVTLTVRQQRMQNGQTLKAGLHLFEADGAHVFDKSFLKESLEKVKAEAVAVNVPLIISGIDLSDGVTAQKGKDTFINDLTTICGDLSIGLQGNDIH